MSPLERLNSADYSAQLVEINDALDNIHVGISFWGARVVRALDNGTSISLKTVTEKLLSTASRRCDTDDLTPQERIAGVEATSKLLNLYQVTDTQIVHCNWFTRLLHQIREFSFTPYTTRFYLDDDATSLFCAYSQEKFLREFGGTFGPDFLAHPSMGGSFRHSNEVRIVALISKIRELLPR
jgi:hypothetical protein